MVRESDDDQVTLIGAGVTLHEALKAADALAADGINARVIDLYSVKPVDADTLAAASSATGGRLVVVEDHWAEGGIGDAVLDVFADADERPRVVKLAVHEIPGSGKGAELLHAAGIDADAIEARRLVDLGPQIGRALQPAPADYQTPPDASGGPGGAAPRTATAWSSSTRWALGCWWGWCLRQTM